MQKTFNVAASSIYPLGVYFLPEGLHISAVCEKNTGCGILLFDKKHKSGIKIPFPAENRKGNICAMLLKDYQDKECSYLFYEDEKLFQDPYAYELVNERKYGESREIPARCKPLSHTYDWEGDKAPLIPFEESIFYLLHVRGFTKHRSSGVQAKGTYAGIIEKIPYLAELGITSVLLMPSYEFDEILPKEKQPLSIEQALASYKEPIPSEETHSPRINYWGYQDGLYFLPKYAYSYQKNAVTEFKDMVKALHQSGIEAMMQFYFPPTVDYVKILTVLKYWVLEYHIDGFQLMGVDIPIQMLCKDPLFADTKLLYEKDFPVSHPAVHDNGTCRGKRNFALMNEAFLYDIRKFLKGDAGMINRFLYLCKENPVDKGIVNYIAKQDGFRLYDLVSYDKKNNGENGENNQDGNDYNYSWNCGIEGKTRKKGVLGLRMRQMKNAMIFIMLSQGTPLIYSGDEFANTQDGNNNPYCQDNAICWVKWNQNMMGEELWQFTKSLIRFRKENPILRSRMPLRGMDYLSCGYPDISFHGKDAWRPQTGTDSRSIGIMYCCRYGQPSNDDYDSFLYFGINMHWEPYLFGLPQMPNEKEWGLLLSTAPIEQIKETPPEELGGIQKVLVPPRTIVIYGTRKKQRIKEGKRKENGQSQKARRQ